MKAHRGLHKKPEGAKRIKAALNHALNLPVRRRRAADGTNFASGRHMLMQVWGLQQGQRLSVTLPQKSQTQRLQKIITLYIFQGNQTDMQTNKAMLQKVLWEGMMEEIPKEQVIQWNPSLLDPIPSRECRKIMDVSLLNEEIQPLHLK
ncbi:MAG: hypothetical protein EZS28_042295 [Streblomastix strix]|uniref:Uncharacterized protein n=1 Tax=Streblomastix strix TaxID=222440 RepID=A0A5J4TV65_9EUKA|nr:MAG: hypothetical protein EZS28_042295 [Streblomastix strix]